MNERSSEYGDPMNASFLDLELILLRKLSLKKANLVHKVYNTLGHAIGFVTKI